MINFKASTCGMQQTTKGICINDCIYILKAPIMSNHWHLTLWHSPSYLKKKIIPTLTNNAYSNCQITLQHSFVDNGKFCIYPAPRQIIQPLEWHCTPNTLLDPHSWTIQSNIYSWQSSCSVLQLPPIWCNDLHAGWNCLGKDDHCPRLGIWKSYVLSWWGIWKWQ